MRTFILLFVFIFVLTCAGFSQEETTASKYTLAAFQAFYNSGKADSIFHLFSAETQAALPLEKTRAFLTQLQTNYGKIGQASFLRYQASFALYKAELEKGVILLHIATDANKAITGIYAKPYQEERPVSFVRNTTKMQLPFTGEWTVFWGGDTKEQNYHVVAKVQRHAFDIIITNAGGKSYKTDGKTNEDYYAFGAPITAACDAEVVFAVDGVKDNVPGTMNTMHTGGNAVLLKTAHNEFVFMAHFKQGSVLVRQGDRVKAGQQIAQCGNSGNSSEPHLHFHIQDKEVFNEATGIKCFFDTLIVNGVEKTDYSPVKGDKVKL